MTSASPDLVSVMMPAYNAAAFIDQAIRSVLEQRHTNWELLVVNDGSTDGTADVARRFADSRIRVFCKENGGESSARNLALDQARGDLIAFLDADDAYESEHLELAVAHLRAHPEHDAVYADGTHIDEQGNRLASLQSRRRGPFQGRIYEEVVLASDVFGPPGCVVLRHDLVAANGLRYDERIVIGPDWDFFVRYADLARFGYIANRTYLYRVHQSNITTSVSQSRRAASLAICRENALAMPSFGSCAVETRTAVFYDLLVNLLRGHHQRRVQALESDRFAGLPAAEQARLLRLTAVDAMLHGDADESTAGRWLARAASLAPQDYKGRILAALHGMSPRLARCLIQIAAPLRGSTVPTAPFADLKPARTTVIANRQR